MHHRQVRVLVFDDDCGKSDAPHPLVTRLFRFGDDAAAWDGLPAAMQVEYYYASIIGMPRNLLALARTNLPTDLKARSYWEIHGNAPNLADRLGSISTQMGVVGADGKPTPFVPFTPDTGVQPSDVCIYSPGTKAKFAFSS